VFANFDSACIRQHEFFKVDDCPVEKCLHKGRPMNLKAFRLPKFEKTAMGIFSIYPLPK
jgi:hypothetical protein